VFLRLRLALIRASRVLPSTPPLFHNVKRHFLGDRLSQILATNQRTLSHVENNDILPANTLSSQLLYRFVGVRLYSTMPAVRLPLAIWI
jgi:hypothetical protein